MYGEIGRLTATLYGVIVTCCPDIGGVFVRLVALVGLAETWVWGRSVFCAEMKELPCLVGPEALSGVVLVATTKVFFAVYCTTAPDAGVY